jgi:hypothetical protein
MARLNRVSRGNVLLAGMSQLFQEYRNQTGCKRLTFEEGPDGPTVEQVLDGGGAVVGAAPPPPDKRGVQLLLELGFGLDKSEINGRSTGGGLGGGKKGDKVDAAKGKGKQPGQDRAGSLVEASIYYISGEPLVWDDTRKSLKLLLNDGQPAVLKVTNLPRLRQQIGSLVGLEAHRVGQSPSALTFTADYQKVYAALQRSPYDEEDSQ